MIRGDSVNIAPLTRKRTLASRVVHTDLSILQGSFTAPAGPRTKAAPDRRCNGWQTYLINPRTFFGRRATSAFDIPKLSAISAAGFADSHLDIVISSNTGLLNRITSFVGSLPSCST